jgi:ABC-2 type transport system ATP-binding protein
VTVAHPDNAALEATGLSKQYKGGALALSNVSLSIRPRSITALVGPNAAGKSTLIKTWVAFERPTAGSVMVMGTDPWRNRSQALSHVGYVPQQPALYRGLTVADHLDVAASVRRGFDKAAALDHLADFVIPLRSRPTNLSGGQQAQVMLAIALGTRADVLLLDEPLASLDPLARSEFLARVRMAVRDRGATAVLSSHIVSDIAQVCDRLIVLSLGQVLLDDSITHAISRHRTVPTDAPLKPGVIAVGAFHDEATVQRMLVRFREMPPSMFPFSTPISRDPRSTRLSRDTSPLADSSVAVSAA